MKWQDVGEMPCSVARALSVIGDRWTMMIVRNAFIGIRRFDDFQSILGMTRHVLADRLNRLVESDILKKVPYLEKPPRYEYRLTKKGMDLYPIILALTTWGDKWMDQGKGAPIEYFHQQCGYKFTPTMVCSECGEPVHAKNVTPMIGPGFPGYADGDPIKSA
ncbi:winged helix-turn-helix transcriptional regulator [Aquirhabdus sp.]|uniref:winged helix-turn-helix transcriptional regulator n=1 Tax=Aquirhabdus sp. TaxID=2824160 RepID=UPI00396C73B9